jgi:UDP-N-acetylmuramate dehydrogenase
VRLLENFSLQRLNTFGIDVRARFFSEATDENSLIACLEHAFRDGESLLFLGGGSNVLFLKDFDGLVVRNRIQGVEVVEEDASHVWVKVEGGMSWHAFVLQAVARNWAGIENLSLIPGTVGAAPIQNIGAYGVEVKDVIHSLEVIHIRSGKKRTLYAAECAFSYRDSIFKGEYKGDLIILSVTFRLQKGGEVNITYGDIHSVLKEMGIEKPGIADVSKAVIHIRQSKLPDPAVLGNAGSFFKNPEVSFDVFSDLKSRYPSLPGYPLEGGVKVPAGWLIEQAGWKGYRSDKVGVHERQALVLVNYGGASGAEVVELATRVQESVEDQFGIRLVPEVNYV